jgi:hypothetical protein
MNLARRIAFAASLCGLLALAACATTEPPTDQVAVTNAALAHAVAAGSVEFAPTEIALARDKMVRANAAMVAKDYDGARGLAQQAQLDAQLAEAKTQAIKARSSAKAVQEDAQVLREEISRKQP